MRNRMLVALLVLALATGCAEKRCARVTTSEGVVYYGESWHIGSRCITIDGTLVGGITICGDFVVEYVECEGGSDE